MDRQKRASDKVGLSIHMWLHLHFFLSGRVNSGFPHWLYACARSSNEFTFFVSPKLLDNRVDHGIRVGVDELVLPLWHLRPFSLVKGQQLKKEIHHASISSTVEKDKPCSVHKVVK